VNINLEDQEPPGCLKISPRHACIRLEDGQLTIEDLGSANGTYINRTKLYPGTRRPLHVNDVIQIGSVQLKVLV
jgi:pSer/pThr/pTyr-binding forkhead associated (FHA) protein